MEYWDAYTWDEQKTGQTLVRGELLPHGVYHIVCDVLVQHVDGSILLMRRASTKFNWPGYWEATAGGSCLKGETPVQCVRRELHEETGLLCRADSFRQVALWTVERNHCIFHCYVCTVDCDKEAIVLQPGETEAFQWMSREEFADFVNSDRMISTQRNRFRVWLEQEGLLRKGSS